MQKLELKLENSLKKDTDQIFSGCYNAIDLMYFSFCGEGKYAAILFYLFIKEIRPFSKKATQRNLEKMLSWQTC